MSDENEQIAEETEPVQPAAETPAAEEPTTETPVESPKSRKSKKKGKRVVEPEPVAEEQPAPEAGGETEPASEIAEEAVAEEVAAEETAEPAPGEVTAENASGESESLENGEPVEQAEREIPAEAPKSGKSRKKGKRSAKSEPEEQPVQEPAADSVSSEEGAAEKEPGETSPEEAAAEGASEEEAVEEAFEPGDEGARHSLPLVVEAILFASQKPMSAKEILSVFKGAADAVKEVPDAPARAFAKIKEAHLREAIESLEIACGAADRAYEVRESAAGWQLVTKPQYSPWLRQLFPEHRSARLSAPAMETLAIIAYRQPITRADIEAVRGVAVDGVMQTLLDRGLVKIAGRADVPGRPLLYDTTQNFMEHFGLKNLDDLPNAAELRKISLPTAEPPPAETPAKAETPATQETPAPAAEEAPASVEQLSEQVSEPAPAGEAEPTAEVEPVAEAEAEPVAEDETPVEAEPGEEPLAEPETEAEISETPVENSPEASDEESRTEN